jgi:uridine phosphorylase
MSGSSFPKTKGKHGFAPLFSAAHVIRGRYKIPKKVVFIYSNSLGSKLHKELKLLKYKEGPGGGGAWAAHNFITPDNELLVAYLPLGAPITASTMEEAIVCGGKEFLIVGAAGGIKNGISLSDIVLCTKSIRDEGTSHHYIAASKYAFPDKKLTSGLEKLLTESKIKFQKGPSWTIDASYAETKKEVNRYKKEGIFTVEMEASALFAVAQRRKVRAAAVFTISDVLGEKWTGFIHSHYKTHGYKRLVSVVKLFKELKIS